MYDLFLKIHERWPLFMERHPHVDFDHIAQKLPKKVQAIGKEFIHLRV